MCVSPHCVLYLLGCCAPMCGSVGFVVDGQVVFGVVVNQIVAAFVPVAVELFLGLTALKPPQAEIHGLGFPWYDGLVGDADSSGVVHLDGSVWLWPTRFVEGLLERDHFLGGGVESS